MPEPSCRHWQTLRGLLASAHPRGGPGRPAHSLHRALSGTWEAGATPSRGDQPTLACLGRRFPGLGTFGDNKSWRVLGHRGMPGHPITLTPPLNQTDCS